MKIFHLPDLGEGLAEAEIREWYVKEGDTVKVDQPLVSMETAKAVVDVPSPYSGKIMTLYGKANEVIKTGAPLISFDIPDQQDNHLVANAQDSAKADKGSVVGQLESSEKPWSDGDVIIGPMKTTAQSFKVMPAARVLAKEMNIDLHKIIPTGPQGLITLEDVKKNIEKQNTVAALNLALLPGQTETLHGVRRNMAKVMTQSHETIVPVTITEDADITDLAPGIDLTTHVIQAIVHAARIEPALNAWFDGLPLERKLFTEVNIGLAVDTPEGLFVPVIKDCGAKMPAELREMIDQFKLSVSNRTILPTDMQGATISLSNFGTIIGRYATPIIVPPMVAIIGCGRSREVALARKGNVIVGRIVPLSLTIDHRAVTGGEASRFLKAMMQFLEGKH